MAYRATRDDHHVTVGDWAGDLKKGYIYDPPKAVADYLVDHGLLVKASAGSEDNPWFDSEDPELNGGVANNQNHGPLSSNVKDMNG